MPDWRPFQICWLRPGSPAARLRDSWTRLETPRHDTWHASQSETSQASSKEEHPTDDRSPNRGSQSLKWTSGPTGKDPKTHTDSKHRTHAARTPHPRPPKFKLMCLCGFSQPLLDPRLQALDRRLMLVELPKEDLRTARVGPQGFERLAKGAVQNECKAGFPKSFREL